MFESDFQVRNRLLSALDGESFSRLSRHMEPVKLPVGHRLVATNSPITHVCFIETGLASTLAHTDGGKSMEVMPVGCEGMTGWPSLLGAEATPDETVMYVAGDGLLVPAHEIRREMERNVRIRDMVLGYINVCLVQVGQLVLANGQHTLRERLARWLLMCHDRLATDNLPITHEFLSTVLGVRRPGITNELHVLEGIHAIRASRGNVRIIDRNLLDQVASMTYGNAEREYEKLIARMRVGAALSGFPVQSISESDHF
ncbi:Crp/Fnr family transcriptional regulator [Rhizobium sp. RM]|uniref:Crp/Fnr family transcriptional regulator n=1 Tax=Rhizobium sp. RM TaxID=2748079 RepID=UPI00110F090D|nr:Crp/Fnr family transcriptional regulator [Rhizobium sp. RM]NWJ27557.1 Crp/Fnr family transcriptional regulator [Rhizobium sp. RM]TMV19985.1 Crp/Fnr family transcriptional regulator [Rhizobium sp. Td3]